MDCRRLRIFALLLLSLVGLALGFLATLYVVTRRATCAQSTLDTLVSVYDPCLQFAVLAFVAILFCFGMVALCLFSSKRLLQTQEDADAVREAEEELRHQRTIIELREVQAIPVFSLDDEEAGFVSVSPTASAMTL